jgi:hypothetical protein
LDAGDQATYTLTITGGAASGCGLDVSVSGDATLQVAQSGTVNAGGDITHTTPKAFSGGTCAFDFKMTAGTTDGPVTLFAAGNSVNLDGTPNGDRAGTTTMDVNVNARKPDAGGPPDAGAPPDAGSTPDAGAPPDAGSPPPDSGTVAPDAGSSGSPPDAGPGAGTPDAGSLGDSTQDLVTEAGCSAAGGTPLLLLAAAALLRFRRRSAKRASLPTQ